MHFLKGAWTIADMLWTIFWILFCYVLLLILDTVHRAVGWAGVHLETHVRRVAANAENDSQLFDDHGAPWYPENSERNKPWGE